MGSEGREVKIGEGQRWLFTLSLLQGEMNSKLSIRVPL